VISVTALGSPVLTQPGLTATEVSVTSAAVATNAILRINVAQTKLSFPGGDITMTLGATTVAGGVGPVTLEADAPSGTSILSHTFSAAGTTSATIP
jgi:hypothetical protein